MLYFINYIIENYVSYGLSERHLHLSPYSPHPTNIYKIIIAQLIYMPLVYRCIRDNYIDDVYKLSDNPFKPDQTKIKILSLIKLWGNQLLSKQFGELHSILILATPPSLLLMHGPKPWKDPIRTVYYTCR